MKKLMLLAAAAAGYVLGSRAGRERYDQIMGTVDKVRTDPRVQEKSQQAVDMAKQHAPAVADKVQSAASAATSKVKSSNGSDSSEAGPHSVRTMAGPQGDLP